MSDYRDFIINSLISNKLEITFPDGDAETITEENIAFESMSLQQSVCDKEALTFGGCIASTFKINLLNTESRSFTGSSLTDKWISVKLTQTYATNVPVVPSSSLYPSNKLFPGTSIESKDFYIFSGYIDSAAQDKNDSNMIHIVAYDALAKLYEEDVTNWLYEYWKGTAYHTLGTLISYCTRLDNGVQIPRNNLPYLIEKVTYTDSQDESTVNMYYPKNNTWLTNQDTISKAELLRSVCELLCTFGFIQPNSGKGEFTMYDLAGTPEAYGFYEKLTTEDYVCTGYTDFKFSVADSSKGKSSKLSDTEAVGGLNDMCDDAVAKVYDFTKNILLWERYVASATTSRISTNTDVLINTTSIGTRLALNAESTLFPNNCAFSAYSPLSATLDGRLWVRVGSPIEIAVSKVKPNGEYDLDENGNIQKKIVQSYVLSRTLTGIQALTDNIVVKGVR